MLFLSYSCKDLISSWFISSDLGVGTDIIIFDGRSNAIKTRKHQPFCSQAKGFFLQMTVYMLFYTCLAALHIFVRPLGHTSSCNDATSSDKIANYSSLIPLQSIPGKPWQPRNCCEGLIVDQWPVFTREMTFSTKTIFFLHKKIMTPTLPWKHISDVYVQVSVF
jgi:hypothetical protein